MDSCHDANKREAPRAGRHRRFSALSWPIVAAACLIPDIAAASPPGPAPALPGYGAAIAAGAGTLTASAPLPDQWWHLFDDPVLDDLVGRALSFNSDLRIALANLHRSRAVLRQARAARLPASDIHLAASENDPGDGWSSSGEYRAALDIGYNIDLFGGVRSRIQAGRAEIAASAALLDAARVSVAAETARSYAAVCGFAVQADVARETLRLQQDNLGLVQKSQQAGQSTLRESEQARVLVEQARARLAGFQAEHQAALEALAVLVGERPPAGLAAARACANIPDIAQPIPMSDGQALLRRRPDIRAAEQRLAADTANIGVATAALYPAITLFGTIGFNGGSDRDRAARGSNWSIGPLISWTFPLNGAARARVAESKAIAEGSLAAFDKTLLSALQETQQALARLEGARAQEIALGQAAAASQNAAQMSQTLFASGAASFLEFLDTQRTLADVRAAHAAAQAYRAETQIALFKALGGGWTNAPLPVRPAQLLRQ